MNIWVIITFLIWFPGMMSYWFSPSLVILNKTPISPFQAMRQSFSACFKNIRLAVVFVLMLSPFYFAFCITELLFGMGDSLKIIGISLRDVIQLYQFILIPVGYVAFLAFLVMLSIGFHVAYRDIFFVPAKCISEDNVD